MIGIVAVSHSAQLAEAALELALQMVPGGGVPVRLAAGAGVEGDGTPILGTDALTVASAIDELAPGCEGVLVLMDLGSAVMSAEMALELRSSTVPVRLSPSAFVEGLLAAVIAAAAGGSLDEVATEAASSLEAKAVHHKEGSRADEAATAAPDSSAISASEPVRITRRVRVRNPLGIHARPAALIAQASAGSDVRLRLLPDGPGAAAASLSRLLVLGARQGDEIELSVPEGAGAGVLSDLAVLFDEGFGEGTDGAALGDSVTADLDPVVGAPSAGASAAGASSAGASAAGTSSAGVSSDRSGEVLRGRGVSAGLAAAPVVTLAPALPEPDPTAVTAPEDRQRAADDIVRAGRAVADDLRSRAALATGQARAILEAASLMAADPELIAAATTLVSDSGRAPERAVWEAAAAQQSALQSLGGRMAERVADVRDVRDRLIATLRGAAMPGVPWREEPFVLVATDLSPADTAALHGGACVALVTEQGGPTSHTAIIARSRGLPAVVGVVGAAGIADGAVVLVDGDRGTVEVDPARERIERATRAAIDVAFDGAGRLADDSPLPLLANVGGAPDAESAAQAGAEGIGLFRTEFCFLDRADAPTIDEQVAAYRGVLSAFPGRKVVVRTLDAGSDKPLPFANADHEENPALGVRGLRVARRNPALLDDQLRALARAAAAETALVEVMAPMVATADEARDFAARARAAGLNRVGVMIETPSAALLAAELFDVVDFVSIGTNDLAQYTLAADRLSGELGDLNDPWQPAVLRLIGAVGAAGRAAERAVGVCGEAAADPALAPVLAGLGVTSLSMSSRALGRVGVALAEVTAQQCSAAAEAALSAATAADARAAAAAALVG